MLGATLLSPHVNPEVIQLALDLPAGVDPERLTEAWHAACSGEALLNATLDPIEGVRPRPGPIPMRTLTVDPSFAGAPAAGGDMDRVLAADAAVPVRPEQNPHRLTWADRPDGSGIWLWTLHHSVADTHSIAVLASRALERYQNADLVFEPAASYGTAVAALPAPAGTARAEEFWRSVEETHTSGRPFVGDRGERISHVWTSPVPDGAGAPVHNSTLVLASAALAAAEASGDPTVVIGNVYGLRRLLPEPLRDVMGPLLAVTPVRVTHDRDTTVAGWLDHVRRADLEARRFITASPPDHLPVNWPLYVNYQPDDWRERIRSAARRAFGAPVAEVRMVRRSSLPLVLDVDDVGSLRCGLDGWSGLRAPEELARTAERLRAIMTVLSSGGGRTLAELGLGAPAPRRRVLALSSGPRVHRGRWTAHELVLETARERPEAVALSYGGRELTYADLEADSARLAGGLRAAGVQPRTRVGLCLPRGIDLYVAILAVLRAGGVYVALDPEYPRARLEFIAADTGVPLVIATDALSDLLPDVRTATVEDLVSRGSGICESDAMDGTGPDDPAYVIHTSGSTGTPKGVVVRHGSLVNLALAQRDRFRVTPEDRVLQFASLGFDASVSEVFVTWVSGAHLVVPAPDERSGPALASVLERHRVTMATLPPTVVAGLDPNRCDLHTLVTAGEPCPRWLVEAWSVGRRLINAYGPTEGTVCATAADLAPGAEIVIGYPIANVSVHLLGEDGEPVRVGSVGEIHLGGAGVAAGYLGRPELTAERFPPDPFAQRPGARMYRSGDLARMREDGALVFLGRTDDQVKVRGMRIEPGEVESVLTAHPGVDQAVAVVQEAGPDLEPVLVAHVVTRTGVVPEGLRRWMADRLPSALVPSAFAPIPRVPLTPNGKVDRSDLPPVDVHGVPSGGRAPHTDLERRLARIWAEVLGRERVGVDDDFLDLGGTSLQAARILARCLEEGDVPSPLTAGTIAAQAASTIPHDTGRVPATRAIPVLRRRRGPARDSEVNR